MEIEPTKQDENASKPTPISLLVAESYRSPLIAACLTQAVVLVLCSLILDFGTSARLAVIAALGHWASIGLILVRRPAGDHLADIWIIQYGYVPIFVLVSFAASWWGRAT